MEKLKMENDYQISKAIHQSNYGQEFNNIININYMSSLLPPPNPLLQRKNIPVSSPKFGRNFNYVKLNPFLKNDHEQEKNNDNLNNMNHSINNSLEKNHRFNVRILSEKENDFSIKALIEGEDKQDNKNNNSNSNNNTFDRIRDKSDVDSNEKFEKNCELGFYINSSSMFPKIVYLRTDLTKDQKVSIDNLVNLKKKSEIQKKIKNTVVKSYYTPVDESDTTLIFESRFESGNLQAAYKMCENSYQLVVQNDTNTGGYSQWFFFQVKNTKKNSTVRFNILNLMKGYSLHNKGMQIAVYSEKKAEFEKIAWYKGGKDIQYYRNSLFKYVRDSRRQLSSLNFKYEFEYDNDTVYFANSIPFLYTDLLRDLNEIQKNDHKYDFFYRKSLCSTLAGNGLEYLTITSNDCTPEAYNSKQGIVLMARVHPGETVSSWMMKGMMDFLCSDCEEAAYLRNSFIFKIIPMMNPDGVVSGNYRTSLAGCDLNRRWINPNEVLHPEIYYAKQMILKLGSQRQIAMICDFHGHSGASNIFMYGNEIKDNPSETRVFPMLISKMSDSFNFQQCSFKMSKGKYGTARINLFHELLIPNIFTIEASFSGISRDGIYKNMQFTPTILQNSGRDVCNAILSYFYKKDLIIVPKYEGKFQDREDEKGNTVKSNLPLTLKIFNFEQDNLIQEIEAVQEVLYEDRENLEVENENGSVKSKDDEQISDGSDSEPSLDNFDNDQLVKLLPSFPKKKKKKNKSKKKILLSIAKTKEKITVDSKNKISIITNIEVNINQNNVLLKPNNLVNNNTNIINLNINNQRPTTMKKLTPSPFMLPITQVSNNAANSPNLLLSTTPLPLNSVKPESRPRLLQSSHFINENRVVIKDSNSRKKDAETQTEEIFFKMPWTYFKSKNYIVLSTKIIMNNMIKSFSTEKKTISNFNSNMNSSMRQINPDNQNINNNIETRREMHYSINKIRNPLNVNPFVQNTNNFIQNQNLVNNNPYGTIINNINNSININNNINGNGNGNHTNSQFNFYNTPNLLQNNKQNNLANFNRFKSINSSQGFNFSLIQGGKMLTSGKDSIGTLNFLNPKIFTNNKNFVLNGNSNLTTLPNISPEKNKNGYEFLKL